MSRRGKLLYFKFQPDFGPKISAANIEKAKHSGGSPEAIQRKIAETQHFMEMYQHPLVNSAITFLEPLPVGLIIAFVSAGIVRRKRTGAGGATLATSSAL